MTRSLLAGIAGAALAVSALSGCSAFSDDTAAEDGEVHIVAGMYPLTFVSERIAGDVAEVVDLTPRGTDPHDLELTPKQTAEVSDADLVLLEAGMQAPLDEAAEQSATGTVFDVSDAARLEPADHLGSEHAHEGEEHAHEGEQGHEHEHDHGELGELDPHFWQDPLRMADVTEAVADQLADIDPDHADTYRANAEKLVGDLTELDEEYTTGLAQCERDTVVVSHNAFGYLTRYGLHFEAISGLTPDAEPTPAALAQLQDLIASEGITTVFSERLASSTMADSLAKDAGVKTAVLDPLEGLTEETADEDYLSLMRANLTALQQANGCR